MSERVYDLHGLVEVTLSPDLRPEIVREIEFQIGFFRSAASDRSGGVPRIRVQSFSARKEASSLAEGELAFYQYHGTVGSSLMDKNGRLAVVREAGGLSIFADFANFLINLYIQLLIAPQGFTMVHAAAYRSSQGAVNVLAGAGGIGKTAVIGYAVRERGLHHLGDDVVILGRSGECLPFPRAFVLKSYHRELYGDTFKRLRLPRWNLYAMKRFLIDNAPFVGLAKGLLRCTGLYYKIADRLRPKPFLATVSVEALFGQGSVARSGEIGRIVYLDRSHGRDFSLRPLDAESLVNRLFALIHYEWKDFLTHLVSLGALDVIDLPAYYEQVMCALRSAATGRELVHVTVPVDAASMQLIEFLDAHGFF